MPLSIQVLLPDFYLSVIYLIVLESVITATQSEMVESTRNDWKERERERERNVKRERKEGRKDGENKEDDGEEVGREQDKNNIFEKKIVEKKMIWKE